MASTQFKHVQFPLSTLIDQIEMGTIALPDIQRPFVWKAAKVRDLFDSLYRGFPIGYLLFWDNHVEPGARQIGTDGKQLAPQQLIVDGQQRLTSLFAVLKGVPVVTQDFKETRIQIAFRPRDEKFAVASAAIRKDPEYVPDISVVWDGSVGFFGFVNGFIEHLRQYREVGDEEARHIGARLERLKGIENFPFSALSLAVSLNEEQVAEIFVRINSEGVRLNQADFILTLMSVFWEKGRKELEEFCRDARTPTRGEASAFNYFIEPDPDQLLRVAVALAFRRARLQNVYSILRGKDLQTGEFSPDRRERQFGALQEAQAFALDLTNWHEFLKALMTAGYCGARMIASQTNLVYTYALYLVGKRDFDVPRKRLRHMIARWFYMTSLTSRYTGSSETQMEADLARFRGLATAGEFVAELDRICSQELTNDFWEIRLPNDLDRSAARSPSLFSYYAALCVLDAPVLFSSMKVSELIDPAMQGRKAALERHHLFPRAYLESIGVSLIGEINQIANYALVEWSDNVGIGARPPAMYYPEYVRRLSGENLDKMAFYHALPESWHELPYDEFLEARRHLMADVIKAGWETLLLLADKPRAAASPDVAPAYAHAPEHWGVRELIDLRESERVEFKSSARWDYRRAEKSKDIEDAIIRTVAGFMNRFGGTLIIGVDDEGTVLGLEPDLRTLGKRQDLDGFENWLVGLLEHAIGKAELANVAVSFIDIEGADVARVDVRRSGKPVYAKTAKAGDIFYVRAGNSTRQMTARETVDYIEHHWHDKERERVPTYRAATAASAPTVVDPDAGSRAATAAPVEVLDEEAANEEPSVRGSGGASPLEAEFHQAMTSIYQRAKSEAGYVATRFIQIVSEHGGLDTARQLLASPAVSDGFTALWEAKRLDLTVEAHVLDPRFRELFTPNELRIAEERLVAHGYEVGSREE